MAARLVDPSHPSVAGLTPNVLVISGFPWYTGELAIQRYLTDVYPTASPIATRLYTNPTNGASRGHCFIEYRLPQAATIAAAVSSMAESTDAVDRLPAVLQAVKSRVESVPFESIYLRVQAYVLTSQRWSRAGRLPELPTDPPVARWRGRPAGVMAGYGDEGFAVRCGAELGLPNTLTVEGQEGLERLRKRLRAASARRTSSHSAAE